MARRDSLAKQCFAMNHPLTQSAGDVSSSLKTELPVSAPSTCVSAFQSRSRSVTLATTRQCHLLRNLVHLDIGRLRRMSRERFAERRHVRRREVRRQRLHALPPLCDANDRWIAELLRKRVVDATPFAAPPLLL